MFASINSFTKNDHLCMAYHSYHFVGEVLLHSVSLGQKEALILSSCHTPFGRVLTVMHSLLKLHFCTPSYNILLLFHRDENAFQGRSINDSAKEISTQKLHIPIRYHVFLLTFSLHAAVATQPYDHSYSSRRNT